MVSLNILVLALLAASRFAIAGWTRQTRQTAVPKALSNEEIATMYFDLSVLRPQDVPDTAIINEALKAIEDLNRKQFCHRLSASMLLDNCRTTEEAASVTVGAPKTSEDERREMYLRIFAISLTMCDIEALQRPVPAQCAAYGQAALMNIKDQGLTRSIHLNGAEMNGCLKAIGQDQSAVVSWKINQQSAAVVCQVTRLDIEKDESIALFAKLTSLMSDVVDEVSKLTKLNAENNRQATHAKEAVSNVRQQVDKFKTGLSDIWTGISIEALKAQGCAKDAFSSMATYASEFESLLGRLRKGALDNHAEQALMHQRSYDVHGELVMKAQETNQEMVELKNIMLQLHDNMSVMGQGLIALQDRQNKVDQQSRRVFQAMVNMTEHINAASQVGEDHTVTLTQANAAAKTLLELIESSKSQATTWRQQMLGGSGPFGIGWALFILTPIAIVLLGSYNRKPSLLQSLGLAVLGVPLAVLISMSCNIKWQDWAELAQNVSRPTFSADAAGEYAPFGGPLA